jgi:hypothetical protein
MRNAFSAVLKPPLLPFHRLQGSLYCHHKCHYVKKDMHITFALHIGKEMEQTIPKHPYHLEVSKVSIAS